MSSGGSSKFTRFATRIVVFAALLLCHVSGSAADTFDLILRKAALDAGFRPAESTHIPVPPAWSKVGRTFFESNALSLNGDISCRDCHLDEFSSADGIPVAIGIGGEGKGADRVMGGGAIIPRNTLPLWGRGGVGFSVFFWDGRVDFSGTNRISQFGNRPPSDDPMVTMVHLPAIEIREMLVEDRFVGTNKRESVDGAGRVFDAITDRLRVVEPDAIKELSTLVSRSVEDVRFVDVANAIASFIRSEFKLEKTAFHRYVFDQDTEVLSPRARKGGLIFFGKGRCAVCHSGPYFSDFGFHGLAIPQLGFGKNGFGVDYGRYNATQDPSDLYKFRTPPLINVALTAPYGHSGSVASLRDTIIMHFDPLRLVDVGAMTRLDRHEFYKKLLVVGSDITNIGFLDDSEVDDLTEFLQSLSHETK